MKFYLSAVFVSLGILLAFPQSSAAQWEQARGLDRPSVGALLVSGPKLYAGTAGSGIFLSEDDGMSWRMISKGIAFTPNAGMSMPPRITSLAVAGTWLFAGTEYRGVYRTNDDGASWQLVTRGFSLEELFRELGAPPEIWISCFAVIGSKLYAGQTDFGVFELSDQGESWRPAAEGMPEEPCVISLAARGNDLFAGTELAGVYVLAASAKKWKKLPLKLPAGTHVHVLLAHGTDLLAGTDAGLFRTSDGGKSWRQLRQGLPEEGTVVALAASGGLLFAGCREDGIFLSTDLGDTWRPLNDGLMDMNVRSLATGRTYLFAGTEDLGVWRLPLAELK